MRKRFFATVLALALAATLCPSAMAAGKLSTPTGLSWGWEWGATDQITCDLGENTTSIVRVVIYKDDRQLTQTEIDCGRDFGNTYMSHHLSFLLAEAGLPTESGVYHFTVQNIVDFGSDSGDNSDVAVSSKWTYTAPNAQLAPPIDPAWDFPYHTWRRGTDAEPQWVLLQLCFCESESGDYQAVFTTSCSVGRGAARTPVYAQALEEHGAGYYKFRVLNMSLDVLQTQHSSWSALSEPYYYDSSAGSLCHHENFEPQNMKSPTCTEPGYSGDGICTDCGVVIWDGENLPALGHDLNADGVCRRCGRQLEYHGVLGQLSWTYAAETGQVTFDGSIPAGETVLAARYQSGRFVDVTAATGDSPTADVGTDPCQLRFFWLDGNQAPQCPAGSLSLEP